MATVDGLPVLSRGKHLDPADGACFMEYASMLAGLEWTDDPPCTHPVLAAIARTVNDATTDGNRAALLPLVPYVLGTNVADPRIAASLVAICATTALGHGGRGRRYLRRSLHAAAASLARADGGWPTASELSWRQRMASWLGFAPYPARRSAERTAALAIATLAPRPSAERDDVLRRLLEQCIQTTRSLVGEPLSGLAPTVVS